MSGFLGGFASGMSKSIEKNRDRTEKKKIAAANQMAKLKESDTRIAGDIQEKRLNSEKTMAGLMERKDKILSGDTMMSSSQATKAVNAITSQMQSVVKGMSQYAADLGKDPREIIDATAYNLNGYKVVDGNLLIDNETEAMIKNSGGQMRVKDGKVEKVVKKLNSTGQEIDEVDGNGKPVFEDTGIKLQKIGGDEAVRPKGERIRKDTPTRFDRETGEYIYVNDEGKDILVNGKNVTKSVDPKKVKKDMTTINILKGAKRDNFLNVINKLDTLVSAQGEGGWGFSEIFGSIAQYIPGTERELGEGFLSTIQANTSFEALRAMREASPTGGALGQVSEVEIKLLMDSIESVNLNQKPEIVKQQLEDLRIGYMKTVHGKEHDPVSNEWIPIGGEKTKESEEAPSSEIDSVMKDKNIDREKAKRWIIWKNKQGG